MKYCCYNFFNFSFIKDEDSFRNNVHNRLSSLDSTMINGNGNIGNGNGHHHFNGSKEDGHSSMNTATTTTMMMNGGYNNHHNHNELNSLWIEHRAVSSSFSIYFIILLYNEISQYSFYLKIIHFIFQ